MLIKIGIMHQPTCQTKDDEGEEALPDANEEDVEWC